MQKAKQVERKVIRKKTSSGAKNISFAHMNKSRRASFKKYRGQGR